jgi:hypothetical protein
MADTTIKITVTRDELHHRDDPDLQLTINGGKVVEKLRNAGIPVIGSSTILAVARGKLEIEYEDGLDGDEWHYTFVGEPVMPEARRGPHGHVQSILLTDNLAEREAAVRARLQAEEDEL